MGSLPYHGTVWVQGLAGWHGLVWDLNVGRDYCGILAWDRMFVGLSEADKIR